MASKNEFAANSVLVSYFDPFDVFDALKEQFVEAFPLQNIHWKAPNGGLRTIEMVPVSLLTESKALESDTAASRLFLRFAAVNCISADDYRAKVRPLIRQWLPVNENGLWKEDLSHYPMPIILLYANSEVVDSKLFKSTLLIDKFAKDFPNVKVLELKSVYKSPKEKKEFWGQIVQHLKSFVLNVFQNRLTSYQAQLSSMNKDAHWVEQVRCRENILELYMAMNLYDEATNELREIKQCITEHTKSELSSGTLEVPFKFSCETPRLAKLSDALSDGMLTKYHSLKYFFVNEFQLLAQDDAKEVDFLRMYRLISFFLHSIEQNFITEANILEFKCSFLDHILERLPHTKSTMGVQIRAELVLAKRDCWIQGVLACTEFTLISKQVSIDRDAYTFGSLKETYSDEATFHENYLKLTKKALSLFNQCGRKRQRTVDILSIEIGVLHHQRREHDKAVSLFLSCYEYYMESKWDVIGLKLLKIFVDSLTNCSGLNELKIDDEAVPVSIILSNAYLNILRTSYNDSERRRWWQKFLQLSRDRPTGLVYATDGLFHVHTTDHAYLSQPNTLSIDVSIDNYGIPEDLKADAVTLTFKNSDDFFVHFQLLNVVLVENEKILTLNATEIAYGDFKPVSLEIDMGSTTFVKQFLDDAVPGIRIEHSYDAQSVRLAIEQARELNLGDYALELSCVNHDKIASSEAIITVQKHDQTSACPISFSPDSDIICEKITNVNEKVLIRYYPKESISSFTLHVVFSFTKTSGASKFSETSVVKIGCYLPVSVSVEDIFKRDMLIFKFLLGSSTTEEPIIMSGTKLLPPIPEDRYSISGGYSPDSPLYLSADPEENCLNCYQITTSDFFQSTDTFSLHITYNTLKEQLDALVTDAVLVQGDVEWYKKFEAWSLVWKLCVLPLLCYQYDAFRAGLIIQLVKDSINLKEFGNLFRKISMSRDVSETIMHCLSRLVKGVRLSEIDISAYSKNVVPRKLIVPVELPRFEQFFYVEFKNKKASEYELGNPVEVTIEIESLNQTWGQNGLAGSFVFEVASSNEWLVHGKKRMRIPSEKSEVHLHIIPLKRGYLHYPKVDIINIDSDEPSRIDYTNYYDTLLVF